MGDMMPVPPDFDAERATADVRWLVEEVGERPHQSAQEQAALAGVEQRLRAAGWSPNRVGQPASVIACRGDGSRLFLAHVDTVVGSPGAIDNAAAVATLLELARTTPADDLCLGFPVGEEVGLRGSRALAATPEDWSPSGQLPRLVVSLDLVGHGTLAVMGIGRAWSASHLHWLAEYGRPLPDSIWAYSVYSRLLPTMERSDHAPFGLRGVPAMLLLGRGEGGVFHHYHQATDDEVEPAALVATGHFLNRLATAPAPPPPTSSTSAAFTLAGQFVPSWATWTLLTAGWVAAAQERRRWAELGGFVLRAVVFVAVCLALSTLLSVLPWPGGSIAEQTALSVMGIGTPGWWPSAACMFGGGLISILCIRRFLGARFSSASVAGLLSVTLVWLDPVLALPFSVAALLSRIHPIIGLLPMLVLLAPDRMRELTFHGLIPPWAWGLLWVLALPTLGGYTARAGQAHEHSESS